MAVLLLPLSSAIHHRCVWRTFLHPLSVLVRSAFFAIFLQQSSLPLFCRLKQLTFRRKSNLYVPKKLYICDCRKNPLCPSAYGATPSVKTITAERGDDQ